MELLDSLTIDLRDSPYVVGTELNGGFIDELDGEVCELLVRELTERDLLM